MALDPNLANWQGAVDDGFDYRKKAHIESIPELANANAIAGGASQLQGDLATGLANQSFGIGGRIKKFNGLQDQYIDNAANYNSEARQTDVTDRAVAGVAQQFESMGQQANRRLERSGINPASGRSIALNNQMQYAQAGAQAAAAYKARNDLETTANDRQKTAIGFGVNLPTQAAQAAQVSSSLANSSVVNGLAPLSNSLSFAGGVGQTYDNARNGYQNLYAGLNMTPGQQSAVSQNDKANDRADSTAFWSTLGNVAASKPGQSIIDKGLKFLGFGDTTP